MSFTVSSQQKNRRLDHRDVFPLSCLISTDVCTWRGWAECVIYTPLCLPAVLALSFLSISSVLSRATVDAAFEGAAWKESRIAGLSFWFLIMMVSEWRRHPATGCCTLIAVSSRIIGTLLLKKIDLWLISVMCHWIYGRNLIWLCTFTPGDFVPDLECHASSSCLMHVC